MFSSIDVGHSRILRQHLLGGPPLTFSRIDGVRSQIPDITSQGARRRWFLCSWSALSDLPHRLLGGPFVNIFCIDGGCSRISGIASKGGRG
jgi:hypothetical protein